MNILNELAAALASGGVETPPKGWKTTQEWVLESGLSESVVFRTLKAALAKGKAERKSFRVAAPGGGVRQVPHYLVKP